jgi:hypothetical protein
MAPKALARRLGDGAVVEKNGLPSAGRKFLRMVFRVSAISDPCPVPFDSLTSLRRQSVFMFGCMGSGRWALRRQRLSCSQLSKSEADVKPWSKLQREVSKLFAEGLRLQIQCRTYRMASARGSTDLPRYWCTLGKDVIWDYPRDFGENTTYAPYDTDVSSISSLLCEYIDTPTDQLLSFAFADRWQIATASGSASGVSFRVIAACR